MWPALRNSSRRNVVLIAYSLDAVRWCTVAGSVADYYAHQEIAVDLR